MLVVIPTAFNEEVDSEAIDQITLRRGFGNAGRKIICITFTNPRSIWGIGALIGAGFDPVGTPELGMIPPGRFIPIAEETGLIMKLAIRLLHETCREAANGWRPGCLNR